MKGWCEKCQSPQEITPDRLIKPDSTFTARYWKLVVHKVPDKLEICQGSGDLI